MRLYVYVLQAKNLPAKNPCVKLQLGKHKSKTRILKNNNELIWNEEFVFRVRTDFSDDEELFVSVFDHDDDGFGFFSGIGSGELVGRVSIPFWSISCEENMALPPTWFSLEKPQNGKFMNADCGKILISISLHGKGQHLSPEHNADTSQRVGHDSDKESHSSFSSSQSKYCFKAPQPKLKPGKKLFKTIAHGLEKVLVPKNDDSSRTDDSSDLTNASSEYEDCLQEQSSDVSFEEGIEAMSLRDIDQEMPENLRGGILVDKVYDVSSYNLNKFLFAPDSRLRKDLVELQGTTDLVEGSWTWKSSHMSHLTQTVTYIKLATKLVKAVRATEEQTYVKANGKEFAILVNVSTPEIPYGSTFTVNLLYKIAPGSELPSGEETSHLIISWSVTFHQSTMMKGMIEGGVQQGLEDNFDQFSNLLAQKFNIIDSNASSKDHILATLEAEHESDWELASKYFCNFTLISTVFTVLYVGVHILLSEPNKVQGLELNGLDLPDSFGQLITCAILVLQMERVYDMVLHFMQARFQRGSDHGVRAKGDGWVLTVALIEGTNIASFDSSGYSDPYVVLTCNGRTRTSSVKLQTSDPQWNGKALFLQGMFDAKCLTIEFEKLQRHNADLLEFDAMEEPPSVLDVEVFDFEGPFDQAMSLGRAEINFLKHTSTEMADIWIPLEGKLAQYCQSKLRLRIFLDNKKGIETIKEYLTKIEKEAGKKLNLRSPHRNSMFQRLFGLPPEEFLINDYTCQLRRRMPLQGRLFLSARIVGFYANLFGHKTKFFFLWEDIDDIRVLPPSLSSVGSPTLVIVLLKGRGLDAKHGAKSQDEEGRLRFYFQHFLSFNDASRTIMALWRTRTLALEQKHTDEDQDQEERPIMVEEPVSVLDVEDTMMSKIYSAELPISMKSLMELFDGGELEHKIMAKSGCVGYSTTKWESVRPVVLERRLSYRFNRHVSIFGGEVICTQQKVPIENGEGWTVNEVMTLHNVPFGEHFHIKLKYHIEKMAWAHSVCKCEVYLGITWLKITNFQHRITRNISNKFSRRLKEMIEMVEREILFRNVN